MKLVYHFMTKCLIGFGLLLSPSLVRAADSEPELPAENQLIIGISAPMSGPYSVLGWQVEQGVKAAVKASGANVQLIIADDQCSNEGGAESAEALRKAGVQLVIGYLCSEALISAAPVLKRDQIAIISLGSQDLSLSEQRTHEHPGIFRLQPGRKAAITAISNQLAELWRDIPFAVIEDGTIQGRDFSRAALAALKAKGLEPVFTDVYKPAQKNQNALVARLKRSGATAVLLGGEADDAVAIGKSAAIAGYDLTIAGSNALLSFDPDSPIPAGTLMIALPEPATLATAQKARHNIESGSIIAEGYTIPAYAALEIALAALARNDNEPVSRILTRTGFDTALGPVTFDADGLRAETSYQLLRFTDEGFNGSAAAD